MFKRSFHSRDRAGKAVKSTKRTFREQAKQQLHQEWGSPPIGRSVVRTHIIENHVANSSNSTLTSPIITLVVSSLAILSY